MGKRFGFLGLMLVLLVIEVAKCRRLEKETLGSGGAGSGFGGGKDDCPKGFGGGGASGGFGGGVGRGHGQWQTQKICVSGLTVNLFIKYSLSFI